MTGHDGGEAALGTIARPVLDGLHHIYQLAA
jgi:hypothetical protein